MSIPGRIFLNVGRLAGLALLSLVFLFSAAFSIEAKAAARGHAYSASIRLTEHGFPHVRAKDYAGLGYGVGYAQIRQRECEVFDRMVVTQSRLAEINGRGAADQNLNSDHYHAWLRTKVEGWLAEPPGSLNSPSREARDLIRGWAAGINRYVEEIKGPDGISDPACRGKPYIGPITELDAWMHVATYNSAAGGSTGWAPIAAAVPPDSAPPNQCLTGRTAALPSQAMVLAAADRDAAVPDGEGSNAYGIGRLGMKGGRAGMLANPHWAWKGPLRYHAIHVSIPGVMNTIGITKDTLPVIWVGHNQTVAWTATVSTAVRFGYWGLQLNPADPTQYLYEGRYEPMTVTCVTARVKEPDGSISTIARPIYETRWGPIARTTALPWTGAKAYAYRTAIGDTEGVRVIDQLLTFQRAKRVDEIVTALSKYGATGRNTTIVGDDGKVFVGDVGGVPKLTDAQLSGSTGQGCLDRDVGAEFWDRRIPVLDGSRAHCAWGNDPDAPPGLAGLASSPHLFRDDYTSQSNQSYWLMHGKVRVEGFSRLFGLERSDPGLRARLGIEMAEDRLNGRDGLAGRGFDMATMKSVMFGNRVLSAEMGRDVVLRHCRAAQAMPDGADLRPACDALAAWDLRYNNASHGAAVWRQFMTYESLTFPFDAADPTATPSAVVASPAKVVEALKATVRDLKAANIAPDAPLGQVATATRQGVRIPMHGGSGAEGAYNVMTFNPLDPRAGWTVNEDAGGASYILALEFTKNGPIGESVLVYSQSANTESEFYKDQTQVYSDYRWIRQRYRWADVERYAVSKADISGD